MKRIIAFVKQNMLENVIFALHELPNFPGAAISDVKRVGQGMHNDVNSSNHAPFHAFPVSIRIEIICLNNQVEPIVATIQEKAHTGLADDGTICISSVDDIIRIRTGDRGEVAVLV